MNIDTVAKKFDVTNDTLRYWERVGILPPVKRNQSGYREYSKYDMNWIFCIKALRHAGMTIEALIEFVELYRDDHLNADVRKSLLIEQRQDLVDKVAAINQTLNYLNYKIDHYEDHSLKYEQEKLSYEEEN